MRYGLVAIVNGQKVYGKSYGYERNAEWAARRLNEMFETTGLKEIKVEVKELNVSRETTA